MSTGSWIRVNATDVNLDLRSLKRAISEEVGHRVKLTVNDRDLRQQIGDRYLVLVGKYVPYRTGKLRKSGTATTDGRVYWTATKRGYNYAYIQYTNEAYKHKYPTTAYWTDKVQPGTKEWPAFIKQVSRLVERRLTDG